MNDGRLNEHVHVPSGQRLLDVEELREKLQCLCQWRIYSVFLDKKEQSVA